MIMECKNYHQKRFLTINVMPQMSSAKCFHPTDSNHLSIFICWNGIDINSVSSPPFQPFVTSCVTSCVTSWPQSLSAPPLFNFNFISFQTQILYDYPGPQKQLFHNAIAPSLNEAKLPNSLHLSLDELQTKRKTTLRYASLSNYYTYVFVITRT